MKLIDGYNLTVGAVLAAMAGHFSQYGTVMTTFLIFNVIDWFTGTCKARLSGKESSASGLRGICKKLGYWVLVFVAFMIGENLVLIGKEMGITFEAASYIGILTLAMLVINEARSIMENLVQMGVNVPDILVRGLAVTAEKLESVPEKKD